MCSLCSQADSDNEPIQRAARIKAAAHLEVARLQADAQLKAAFITACAIVVMAAAILVGLMMIAGKVASLMAWLKAASGWA